MSENRQTDREQTDREFKPEATLIPVDRRGERANFTLRTGLKCLIL